MIAKRALVRENHAILPVSVKRAGYASLVLWTLVIICGRLIRGLSLVRWFGVGLCGRMIGFI